MGMTSSGAAGRGANEVRRGHRRRTVARNLAAYGFMAPYLFILFIFTVGASIYGFGLSLFHANPGIDANVRFIGLDNYRYDFDQLVHNPGQFPFAIALKNIVVYAFFVIIAQTTLALILALLLNLKVPGRSFIRTAIYLPSVTSSVALALIFLFLYNKTGAINGFLGNFHLPQPDWLQDPTTALPAIMSLNIWSTAPTFMIMFLAALQGLPEPVYEAARMDGCNSWQILRHITLPLLRPTLFLVVALGTIGSLQVFDQIAILTKGGPLNSTLTPVYVIYQYGFQESKFGLGSSMGVILFVLIFSITLVQRRFIDTTIEY